MASERTNRPRVVTVVVAYNRRDLLAESLAALRAQTHPSDVTLVVDNASDDGTSAMVLERFPEVELVRLGRNTGGAGGFTVGIQQAIDVYSADLVWLMDDDTVPTGTALEELLLARLRAPAGTIVLASKVVWVDGREHPMNMPRTRPFARRAAIESAAEFGCYPIRSASFVSLVIDADATRQVGLPVADYFLWNDDFEFTARLLRRSRGYVATRSVVVHKTRVFGSTDVDPGPRFRLEVRNKLWVLLWSPGLAPAERVIYTMSTLRRWVTTFLRSSERAVLRAGLVRGVAEGIRGRPRSNTIALAGLGAITAGIEAFEAGPSKRGTRGRR